MNVDHVVSTYGYVAVAAFVALESLGVPLPGETVLVAAGAYAGRTHHLSVWAIFAFAAAAAILGDNIGYLIGAKGGYRLLRRWGGYLRIDEAKLKVGRYLFARHGGKLVFLGRFVSVLRTYAAFLAGTNRMPWRQFLVFNAAGGIAWAAIYSFVPYHAGDSLRRVSGTVDVGVVVAAAAAVVAGILVTRRHAGRLTERAEAAFPGHLEDP